LSIGSPLAFVARPMGVFPTLANALLGVNQLGFMQTLSHRLRGKPGFTDVNRDIKPPGVGAWELHPTRMGGRRSESGDL